MRKSQRSKENEQATNNPENDRLVLRWSNIALSNRLDHLKLECASQTRQMNSTLETHSHIFAQFFTSWKVLVTKLQQQQQQQLSSKGEISFEKLFSPSSLCDQLTSIIEACIHKTKNASLPSQADTIDSKITGFMKCVESAFEAILQAGNPAATSTPSANEKSLIKENGWLKQQIVKLETTQLELNQKLEQLEERLAEKIEQNEFASMRLRQAMDYRQLSITTKTGTVPSNLASLLEKMPSRRQNSAASTLTRRSSSAMEIEAQHGNGSEAGNVDKSCTAAAAAAAAAAAMNSPPEQLDSYECVCGGYQVDYFYTLYEETLDKIIAAQTKTVLSNPHDTLLAAAVGSQSLIAAATDSHTKLSAAGSGTSTATITTSDVVLTTTQAQGTLLGSELSTLSAPAGSLVNTAVAPSSAQLTLSAAAAAATTTTTAGGSTTTNLLNNQAAGQLRSSVQQATGVAVPVIEGGIIPSNVMITSQSDLSVVPPGATTSSTPAGLSAMVNRGVFGKYKLSLEEEVVILRKEKEELVKKKIELELLLRDFELDSLNLVEKFFHSELYASLAAQTSELLRSTLTAKQQSKDLTRLLSDLEKMRYTELHEILNRAHEDQLESTRNLNAVKEDVFRNQLVDIMRSTLTQFFNHKKYTEPLAEQIARLSESVDLLRQNSSEMKAQNISLQSANDAAQKTISELQTKLQESTEQSIHLESIIASSKSNNNNNNASSSFIDEKSFKYPKQKDTLKMLENLLMKASSMPDQQVQLRNFRELAAYLKGREEKIVAIEAKLRESDNERKKLLGSIDGIWKDYESLDTSFASLKKGFDFQTSEMKKHAEREQELETKNLEMIMKLQKEHAAQKVLLAADQAKNEAAKIAVDALKEQNASLVIAGTEGKNLLEDFKTMYAALKTEAEEANCELLDVTVQMQLLQKKHDDLLKEQASLISNHEKTKQKLLDAYDVMDNYEEKQKQEAMKKEDPDVVTEEQKKIQNLMSIVLCQCKERFKDVVIQTCSHTFCRQCANNQIKSRQRTCPNCRTKFQQDDILGIFLES